MGFPEVQPHALQGHSPAEEEGGRNEQFGGSALGAALGICVKSSMPGPGNVRSGEQGATESFGATHLYTILGRSFRVTGEPFLPCRAYPCVRSKEKKVRLGERNQMQGTFREKNC